MTTPAPPTDHPPPVVAPPPAAPIRQGRPIGSVRRGGAALAYAGRVALVVGALLAWTNSGWRPAWDSWQAAAHTPSAAGVSYDAQRLTLEGNTLYPLLVVARTVCPAPGPVLGISEDSRAEQQGNYILYPRRVDMVRNADPLGQATITAHTGGCVFYYGPTAGRLDPFRPQLTELACTRDGCLYRINRQ